MNPTEQMLLESLQELKEEEGMSRLLNAKIDEVIIALRDPVDAELKKDRIRGVLDELDEIPTTPNDVRSQLWMISAMVEQL